MEEITIEALEADPAEQAEQTNQPAEKWTSWDNPVATPERWLEVRRAVEAGMAMSDASKVFKISYEAMRKRAQREEWITERRLEAAKAEIKVPNQSQGAPVEQKGAETAIQALAAKFEGHRSGTMLKLAEAVEKGASSLVAANLTVESWEDGLKVAQIASKLFGLDKQAASNVQVNVLTDGNSQFSGGDFPVYELED